ncbi:MAG: HAD family hydrolase [Bryobacteraceae bacterium]|nr:HAD family hydrolase [Bryobacteraceae bacterium]MDW8379313.1 HAD family hydrolase [Bryobacterales bacterium]
MIEIINRVPASRARVVLFDFDGTLSLIRSGWVETMVPMMVEVLASLKTGESEAELTEIVRDYVGRLTGKDTIYQMIELAEQVAKRGGKPEDPLVYKRRYLDLLWTKIRDRVEALRSGEASPEQYLVPGSRALLESLRQRGLKLYLASGTDDQDMKEEARLLDIARYFDGGCWGALDDYKSFSKAILIQRIIQAAEAKGEEFLGFGDGFVEIENVKQVGGVAVGVATEEPHCQRIDAWKRERLVKVGADYIVANYLPLPQLQELLFPNEC